MTDKNPNSPASLDALLEERAKFESWLAQLEARRSNAAEHVFARVHADYTAKLDDVKARLAGEADAISTLVAELGARLRDEQEFVTAKGDERAEAELRASVGEYSEKEWKSVSAKLDAALAEGRARFEATERQLGDLQVLLASISGASRPPRASLERSAEIAVVDDLAEAEYADGMESVEQSHAEPEAFADEAQDAAGADDAGIGAAGHTSASTFPSVDESMGVAMQAEDTTPPAVTPDLGTSGFDELAFLRSVAGTPARPAPAAAVSEGIAADSPKPKVRSPRGRGTIEEPATGPRPQAPVPDQDTEGSALGGPTPRTSQAVRSLKCQECGTLNFPTEWYCERCGGELAAF